MTHSRGALLCVANYPANVGYAWDLIERIYARLADHLAAHGVRTLVAYPEVRSPPRALEGSSAVPVVVDTSLATRASVRDVLALIRRERVRSIYFTDRPARSWVYPLLRLAGARQVVVHDHTSGARTRPAGLRRAAKWLVARAPGVNADTVIAVSDYVARRSVDVGLLPPARVIRVHNGLPEPPREADAYARARQVLGLPPGRPLIMAASRASSEKGIAHLLRAFDRMMASADAGAPRPVLVYIGDGPQLEEWRRLRDSLAHRDDVVLTGYRGDAASLIAAATVCVVPSVWEDAFPTSVLEALMRGRPVVATRVGGIPEMVDDGRTGVLVEPGDEGALADALRALLRDPDRARRIGDAAREHTVAWFTPERQTRQIAAVIEPAFGLPRDAPAARPPLRDPR